ncbi:MAG: FMN reductase, partial [Mycobacteriaceae bacterium]|nr:FMN reductase [Mycobacteriaceae bacterium]
MAETKVLALVGSLRAASLNRQVAELAVDKAPDGITV